MIRNPRSAYEPGKRSNGLLKMKMFETDEFEIVGVHEGTGRDIGTPMWECGRKVVTCFPCDPRGPWSREEKRSRVGRKSWARC
jgi:hypothetical protein